MRNELCRFGNDWKPCKSRLLTRLLAKVEVMRFLITRSFVCGICGYLGLDHSSLLRRMTNTLKHIGPDDVGLFADRGIGLGMRKLSIIDLESGHQPIHDEDQSVRLVFKLEIYNFRDLHNDLLEKPTSFVQIQIPRLLSTCMKSLVMSA